MEVVTDHLQLGRLEGMVGALPQRPEQHSKTDGQTPTCPQWVVVVDLGLKGAV